MSAWTNAPLRAGQRDLLGTGRLADMSMNTAEWRVLPVGTYVGEVLRVSEYCSGLALHTSRHAAQAPYRTNCSAATSNLELLKSFEVRARIAATPQISNNAVRK